jgi:flagellin-like protein
MRGISEVLSTVLLIAIVTIAGVGIYFWADALRTPPSATKTDLSTTIAVTCIGGFVEVTNRGTRSINDTLDAYNMTHIMSSGSMSKLGVAPGNCEEATIASAESCNYASGVASGAKGTILASMVHPADFEC